MPIDRFNILERLSALVGLRRVTHDHFHFSNTVEVVFRDRDGNVTSRSVTKNLKVNAGNDFLNTQMFGVSGINGQTGTAGYIAMTTNSSAPAAGDTTLASEETLGGLARSAQLTPTHGAGTGSTVFTKTFTYDGSNGSRVIAKVGLFNASSAGTLVFETLLATTGTVNTNGDTIAITWTITY